MKSPFLLQTRWAAWALCGVLGSCSTPVTRYAPAHLLPVPAVRPFERTRSLAGSRLCQGLGTEWDSVLVVMPYTPPAAVRALGVANYGAIRQPVTGQELDEGTCTLLLVKNGRYTGYSVFPRTVDWTGFSRDKAPQAQLMWLTKQDCARLMVRCNPVAGDISAWYTVRLAAAKPMPVESSL